MAQQIQFSEEQEVVILTKMRKKLVEFFWKFLRSSKGFGWKMVPKRYMLEGQGTELGRWY